MQNVGERAGSRWWMKLKGRLTKANWRMVDVASLSLFK